MQIVNNEYREALLPQQSLKMKPFDPQCDMKLVCKLDDTIMGLEIQHQTTEQENELLELTSSAKGDLS